jgi:signal transduction histidine kinase/CheY-like chemotaxis protein
MAEDQGRYDQLSPMIVASLDTAADIDGAGHALLVLTGQAIAPKALAHFRRQHPDAAVVLVLDEGEAPDPALVSSDIDGLITAADRVDTAVLRIRLAVMTHTRDRLLAAAGRSVLTSSEPPQALAGGTSASMAAVVHELRTPLTGIAGMLEVLRHGRLDEEQSESIDTIEQATGAVLRIINDLLDAAKIEAGKLDIEAITYDPIETIEQTVAAIVPGVTSDAVLPVVFIDPTVPTRLIGDPNRLRQVVTNLVSNAFKFTHTGRVGVTATTVERDGQRWLQVTVADTGIGMSPDTVAKLFKPFAQADAGTARRYGGTGLGLNVSHRLVELMGGVIQVASTLGSGSRFWFELPLTTVANAPARHSNWLRGKGVVTLGLDQETTEAVLTYASLAGAWTRALTPEALVHEADTALAATSVITPADPALAEQFAVATANVGTGAGSTKGLIVIGAAKSDRAAGFEAPAALRPLTWLPRPVRESSLIRALLKKCDDEAPRRHTVVGNMRLPQIKIDHPFLLVDDHPISRDMLSQQFKILGLPCEVLSDAALALEALEQRPFAGMLSDCEMSGISGFELATRVRHMINQQRLPPMPLLAITAHIDPLEMERALTAGFDVCLSKPLTLKALQDVLTRFLAVSHRVA